MRVEEMKLPTSNFIEGYINNKVENTRFFDYENPFNKQLWIERQQELKRHSFPRKELKDYLLSYNQSVGCSSNTIDAIHKLTNPDTLAVVGGQQAGLLSGPLLVIYKCISTIQLAKQAERELGVPVVPIFWIAGEDHDMDEINHVKIPKNGTAKKLSLKAATAVKSSASMWQWKPEEVKPWLNDVFRSFGETAFTHDLHCETERVLEESDSIVQFFAKLLSTWFSKEGLILLDSGDPAFKYLQTDHLKMMLSNNEKMDKAFRCQTSLLTKEGYPAPIEVQQDNVHLFYTYNDERMLLYRHGEQFTSKDKDFFFTEDELLEELQKHPDRFSNNVVTRPLMQEFMIPTLSFIAGPGEISYWATLKEVFHLFDRKMPILMPRLSITLVSEITQNLVNKKDLTVPRILEFGTEDFKSNWYEQHRPVETNESIQSTKAEITHAYSRLKKLSEEIDEDLLPITEKNLERILAEVNYIEHKMEQRIRKKVKEPLAEFDEISLDLKPTGVLQERVWNVYQYMNAYGPDLIQKMMEISFSFNEKHKIVYL